ncbi:hypothetical protein [Aliikangiella maris]|uniref:Uncharacterized protein n=2 Tax=Aliikangiella maris TaxID=3162458 RepID=A0ABV3MTS8_9GAMM
MKKIKIIFLVLTTLLITSCSVDEEVLNSLATKEEVSLMNESIEQRKLELKNVLDVLDSKVSEIEKLKGVIEEYSKKIEKLRKDQEFIAELRLVDFSQITETKAEIEELKLIISKKEKESKKQEIALKKQKILRKNRLEVSLSQINTWGDRLVAILHFPKEGFKTLSTNHQVGNGWEISKIEKTNVYFVHKSGAKKSLKL